MNRLHFQFAANGLPVALWYGDEHIGDLKAIRKGRPPHRIGHLDAFDGLEEWRYSHWPDPPFVTQQQ